MRILNIPTLFFLFTRRYLIFIDNNTKRIQKKQKLTKNKNKGTYNVLDCSQLVNIRSFCACFLHFLFLFPFPKSVVLSLSYIGIILFSTLFFLFVLVNYFFSRFSLSLSLSFSSFFLRARISVL